MNAFWKKPNVQMSEAFITMFFLTLSGGLQDTYTYLVRGGVFANAETGNIVLMSTHLFQGDFGACIKYIIPITSFALGIYVAEKLHHLSQIKTKMHWRQKILLFEIALLALVAFLPTAYNNIANAMVSFCCAMQVQSFRKVNGHPFASTMCIGNLRSGMEAYTNYLEFHDPLQKNRAIHYFGIILTFALGAGIGAFCKDFLHEKLILLSCLFLFVGFCLMFLPFEESYHE